MFRLPQLLEYDQLSVERAAGKVFQVRLSVFTGWLLSDAS